MLKLIDYDKADPTIATIYADTKEEVPETADGIRASLEGDLMQIYGTDPGAGTMIITSTFDVAFVRSDGLIQWKGEDVPSGNFDDVEVDDGVLTIGSAYLATEDEEGVLTIE